MNIDEIIESVKTASLPNWRLDKEITLHTQYVGRWSPVVRVSKPDNSTDHGFLWGEDASGFTYPISELPYTSNMAYTVEAIEHFFPDFEWCIIKLWNKDHWVYSAHMGHKQDPYKEWYEYDASTAAVALCVIFLRAWKKRAGL